MHEISLPARMESMIELQAALREAAHLAGLEEACILRAELVLEELLTNSIVHGYSQCTLQAQSSACVWVRFEIKQASLNICYQDAAIAYNPLEYAQGFLQSMGNVQSVLDRQTGGLGCVLIKQLSDSSHYAFENGRNQLFLTFCQRQNEPSLV
jgi:anti-sigma regulatory factor (Ser/Thr protein kinase)